MIKIGVIKYINSIPLYSGLERYGELVFDTPRNLAERFAEGELDVSFIPSVAYVRNKSRYCLINDVSISSFGRTNSVFLVFNGDIRHIHAISLNPESITSNAIVKAILKRRYNRAPLFIDSPFENGCDGRVVIGDMALNVRLAPHEKCIDVGTAWFQMTGLPLVYAVCVSAHYLTAKQVGPVIRQVKERNLSSLDRLLVRRGLRKYYSYLHGLNYDLRQCHKESLSVLEEVLLGDGQCAVRRVG